MTLHTLADTKNKLENIERMGFFNISLVECIHCINNWTVSEKTANVLYCIKVHNIRTVNFLFLTIQITPFLCIYQVILMSYNSAQHANVTRSDTLVSKPTHLQVEAFKSGASN